MQMLVDYSSFFIARNINEVLNSFGKHLYMNCEFAYPFDTHRLSIPVGIRNEIHRPDRYKCRRVRMVRRRTHRYLEK